MYIWHILSKLRYILSHQDSVGRAPYNPSHINCPLRSGSPTSRWSFRTKKTCPFSTYFFRQILWLRLWTPFPYLCKKDLGNGHPLIVLSLSSPQATCASMKWTNLKKKIIASSVCQGPPRSIWVWLWPSWRVMMIRMMMTMVMMWLGKSFCHLAAYESGPLEEWSPPQWRKLFNIRTFVIRGQVFCCHSRSSAKLSFLVFFGSLRMNEAIPSAVAIHKLWRCRWYQKSTFEQILIKSLIIRE